MADDKHVTPDFVEQGQDESAMFRQFMQKQEQDAFNYQIQATDTFSFSSNQMQSEETPILAHGNPPETLTLTNPASNLGYGDPENLTNAPSNLGYGNPETLTNPASNLGYGNPETLTNTAFNFGYGNPETLTNPAFNFDYGNLETLTNTNLGCPGEGGAEGGAASPEMGRIVLRYKCGLHPKKAQPYAEWKVSFCPCDFKRFRFTFDKL